MASQVDRLGYIAWGLLGLDAQLGAIAVGWTGNKVEHLLRIRGLRKLVPRLHVTRAEGFLYD